MLSEEYSARSRVSGAWGEKVERWGRGGETEWGWGEQEEEERGRSLLSSAPSPSRTSRDDSGWVTGLALEQQYANFQSSAKQEGVEGERKDREGLRIEGVS